MRTQIEHKGANIVSSVYSTTHSEYQGLRSSNKRIGKHQSQTKNLSAWDQSEKRFKNLILSVLDNFVCPHNISLVVERRS